MNFKRMGVAAAGVILLAASTIFGQDAGRRNQGQAAINELAVNPEKRTGVRLDVDIGSALLDRLPEDFRH